MVLIVETGISLMELDWDSLTMVISMRVVVLRELIYVVGTIPPHQLVSIAVITNAIHDDRDILVKDTVYVGLYTGSGGMFPA